MALQHHLDEFVRLNGENPGLMSALTQFLTAPARAVVAQSGYVEDVEARIEICRQAQPFLEKHVQIEPLLWALFMTAPVPVLRQRLSQLQSQDSNDGVLAFTSPLLNAGGLLKICMSSSSL
jgi:hypothetical protein